MKEQELDSTDKKLVFELEQDARLSYAALGEKVGLSKTPCWNRVSSLNTRGVIQAYSARLRPDTLGLHIRALVHVVVNFDHYQAFEQAIVAYPNVRSCHAVTGEFDYVLEILASDIPTFDTMLREQLSQFPGVMRFNTSITTRMVKTDSPYAQMV